MKAIAIIGWLFLAVVLWLALQTVAGLSIPLVGLEPTTENGQTILYGLLSLASLIFSGFWFAGRVRSTKTKVGAR